MFCVWRLPWTDELLLALTNGLSRMLIPTCTDSNPYHSKKHINALSEYETKKAVLIIN
jgi:hypothetical protein